MCASRHALASIDFPSQGCPQPWAYASGTQKSLWLFGCLSIADTFRIFVAGIGSGLLRKPEIVADMVRAVKDRMGWEYHVSVKIRVDTDLKCVSSGRSA